MSVILVYGDSNSHGTPPAPDLINRPARYAHNARWPSVMADALGPSFEVINSSLPGRTTVYDDPVYGEMRNGRKALPAVLMAHIPDILVLKLGTNDLQYPFGARACDVARNLESLVHLARFHIPHLPVILIAPPPVNETGAFATHFEGAKARQSGMKEAIFEIATQTQCLAFDAAPYVQASAIDGVHYSAEGQRALGAAMAEFIRETRAS